jgi:hypothetical protein
VAGPWVHRGPHNGRRPESSPELALGAAPGHGGLRRRHGRQEGRRGDPSGGLTLGGGTTRRPSDGGERSSAVALGVRGARGEEVKRGERG